MECHQEARQANNKDEICRGNNLAYQAYVYCCWSSPPPAQACKLESCKVDRMAQTKSHRGPTRYLVPEEWDKPSKIRNFECRARKMGWRSTSSYWAVESPIPYKRLILWFAEDAIKIDFLRRADAKTRLEVDAQNSPDVRPPTVFELIADKWNDSAFNPVPAVSDALCNWSLLLIVSWIWDSKFRVFK